MHELSLAQSLLGLIEDSAREQGIARVGRVNVVVGEWSAVLPYALASSFEILASQAGERFAGASLDVVVAAATGECQACGARFAAWEGLTCPACGGAGRLISGTELYIDSYEGE